MLSKVSKKSRTSMKKVVPVIQVKMTENVAEFEVHLGPYMPFNSGGEYNPTVNSISTVKK